MVRFGDEPRKLYKKTKLAFKDKYNKDTIKKWLRLFYWRFFSQQFKRSCIPDGQKLDLSLYHLVVIGVCQVMPMFKYG